MNPNTFYRWMTIGVLIFTVIAVCFCLTWSEKPREIQIHLTHCRDIHDFTPCDHPEYHYSSRTERLFYALAGFVGAGGFTFAALLASLADWN